MPKAPRQAGEPKGPHLGLAPRANKDDRQFENN